MRIFLFIIFAFYGTEIANAGGPGCDMDTGSCLKIVSQVITDYGDPNGAEVAVTVRNDCVIRYSQFPRPLRVKVHFKNGGGQEWDIKAGMVVIPCYWDSCYTTGKPKKPVRLSCLGPARVGQ